MKRRKYIIIFIIFIGIMVLFKGCFNTFVNEEQEIFTSPQGTNTIIVQYDFTSRPIIYKKGLFWNKKIWEYEEAGFMETVHFGVEWISENQIYFTYDDVRNDEYDEEYIITIPE